MTFFEGGCRVPLIVHAPGRFNARRVKARIASWDWQPHVDASRRYMRNHIDLDTLEAMARFPPVRR
jgi:hypothetical protein